MEGAGKLVDDEDLADAMKERGLGTPATRADTIDGLINQKYMERNQRELAPTPKAEQLLEFLTAVRAEELTQPRMTGEWEYKLRQMEHGKFSRDQFMREIIRVTEGIVERTKTFEETDDTARTTDIIWPADGKPLLETLRGYRTQDGTLTIYKVITGRKIDETEIRQLVATGEIGPLDDFVSPRTGNRFPAKLRIVPDPKDADKKKVELDFGNKVDLGELQPIWTDPATGVELCEAPTNYILRQRDPATDTGWKQTFSVGRIMCKRPLERKEVITLVTTGKSPLIENFTSKFGRPFKAYLVKNGAKIGFEFPPREAKTGPDGKPAARGPRKAKAPLDLKSARVLGLSKLHADGTLYETADAYIVAKPGADDQPRTVFEVKKNLCSLDLPAGEIQRLVTEGKTDLIEGFVSKRGSKFSAYLVLNKTKTKADFEFPPR
ncbi:type IA DNA topoisomerase [Geminisphaera colitermitum]|uniref:type IA DNA topoisomerase n=1 Tax=Geminisphaera colitermitum TaxID=1148786 RepID=UPI0022B7E0F6|nr:type IA DNA topoisomerase [Geminisphaera colitermitum]